MNPPGIATGAHSDSRVAPMLLTELRPGNTAVLHSSQLDQREFALLEAMGLTGGCRLRVCKQGEPTIVQVRATRVALTAAIARSLLVLPAPDYS